MSVSPVLRHRSVWQQQLADAIRDPLELLQELELCESLLPAAREAAAVFGLMVPRGFAALMEPGNVNDPLLRQVLPIGEELTPREGYVDDPLREADARRAPGLIHKYAGRALLIATGHCAINCRYCFRRVYPYQQEPRRLEDWEPGLQELRSDASVSEVILSGGDPLMLNDSRLDALITEIESIEHVTMLRIHSRLPIVLPDRMTPELLSRLQGSRLQTVLVVHSNHPAELSEPVRTALQQCVRAGVPTLNQSVLLRGVNDCPETLCALSRTLTHIGVLPYYLHQLDRVTGTAHFEVPRTRGVELIAEMRARLPGYAVPRFVVEEPGREHKTIIA